MQNAYTVLVRKDSSTILPVQVPQYEIAILETLYGEENVLNADLKLGSEHGFGDPVGQFEPSDDEHNRLAIKYGSKDSVPVVELVYGKRALKAIDKRIKADDKPAKKSAKADE